MPRWRAICLGYSPIASLFESRSCDISLQRLDDLAENRRPLKRGAEIGGGEGSARFNGRLFSAGRFIARCAYRSAVFN